MAAAKDKTILFHSKAHPFSNFYSVDFSDTIVIRGDKEKLKFSSVEQYLQACKAVLFQDFDKFKTIMSCDSALEAKDWGRVVAGFDDEKWCNYAKDIVIRGCWCKFTQNPALGSELCRSGQYKLGECSTDTRWGIGLGRRNPRRLNSRYWRGQNWLGDCLEVVRARLRDQSVPISFDISLDNLPIMDFYQLLSEGKVIC